MTWQEFINKCISEGFKYDPLSCEIFYKVHNSWPGNWVTISKDMLVKIEQEDFLGKLDCTQSLSYEEAYTIAWDYIHEVKGWT